MVADSFGQAAPRHPITFQERVAHALCAFDIAGGEGRMTDEELAELDELLALARQVHGVEKAWRKFRHIQAFARLDRDLRHREGGAVMHAHLIAADWPNYQGAADAVLSVMLERPEVVREILSETTAGEGRDKE